LVLKVETEIPLAEPNEDFGFVTRLAVTVREFDSPSGAPIGTAEVALIHCAEALNKGVSISDVLDEDSEELTALYGVFFEDDSLKEEYSNGVGLDVLYVAALELHPDWRGRKIEEAVVRRVFDVWGTGCAIGVMALASPDESSRWESMGFELVEDAEDAESTTSAALFVFMKLSLRQPMVVEGDAPEHTFQLAEAPRLEFHVDADDFENDAGKLEDDELEDDADDLA
jgi:GNAT superfamily N-acetyltransferase